MYDRRNIITNISYQYHTVFHEPSTMLPIHFKSRYKIGSNYLCHMGTHSKKYFWWKGTFLHAFKSWNATLFFSWNVIVFQSGMPIFICTIFSVLNLPYISSMLTWKDTSWWPIMEQSQCYRIVDHTVYHIVQHSVVHSVLPHMGHMWFWDMW